MIGVDGAIPPTGRVTPPLRLVLLAGVLTATAICTDPAPVAVQEDYDYGANSLDAFPTYLRTLRTTSLGQLAQVWQSDVQFVLDRLEAMEVPAAAAGVAAATGHGGPPRRHPPDHDSGNPARRHSDFPEILGAPGTGPVLGEPGIIVKFTAIQNDLVLGFLDRYVKGNDSDYPAGALARYPELMVRNRDDIRRQAEALGMGPRSYGWDALGMPVPR